MTIHAHVGRRNGCLLSFKGRAMTIQTVYLVETRMHLMRIVNRLSWLKILLSAKANQPFAYIISYKHEQNNGKHGYVHFVLIKGYRFGPKNSFRIIAQFFQVTIHLHQYQGNNGHDKR